MCSQELPPPSPETTSRSADVTMTAPGISGRASSRPLPLQRQSPSWSTSTAAASRCCRWRRPRWTACAAAFPVRWALVPPPSLCGRSTVDAGLGWFKRRSSKGGSRGSSGPATTASAVSTSRVSRCYCQTFWIISLTSLLKSGDLDLSVQLMNSSNLPISKKKKQSILRVLRKALQRSGSWLFW